MNEQLSSFEGLCLEEVLVHYFNNGFLLREVVIELLKDMSQTGAGCISYFADGVVAELEEHWQELIIDCVCIKELGVLAKVLGKD